MQDNNKLVNKVSELQEVGTIGSLSATKKSKVWAFLSGNHSSTIFKKNAKLKCLAKSLYSKCVRSRVCSVQCHLSLKTASVLPKAQMYQALFTAKNSVLLVSFFPRFSIKHSTHLILEPIFSKWCSDLPTEEDTASPGPSQLPDFVISCQVILE